MCVLEQQARELGTTSNRSKSLRSNKSMRSRFMGWLVLPTALLGLGLAPAPSLAGIMFQLGNNPQPNEENVLLNTGTTGNTVFGVTNQSNIQVRFDSTQTLLLPANGQARVEATS